MGSDKRIIRLDRDFGTSDNEQLPEIENHHQSTITELSAQINEHGEQLRQLTRQVHDLASTNSLLQTQLASLHQVRQRQEAVIFIMVVIIGVVVVYESLSLISMIGEWFSQWIPSEPTKPYYPHVPYT